MAAKTFILTESAVGKNREIFDALKRLKSVASVNYVTGPYDIIAKVEARNLNNISDLVSEKIYPIPRIIRTTIRLSLKVD